MYKRAWKYVYDHFEFFCCAQRNKKLRFLRKNENYFGIHGLVRYLPCEGFLNLVLIIASNKKFNFFFKVHIQAFVCDCQWVKFGCGDNDGSYCWNQCCGKKRSTKYHFKAYFRIKKEMLNISFL